MEDTQKPGHNAGQHTGHDDEPHWARYVAAAALGWPWIALAWCIGWVAQIFLMPVFACSFVAASCAKAGRFFMRICLGKKAQKI